MKYCNRFTIEHCIAGGTIRDTKSFKELSFYLLTNFASTYSYNSLSKAINITDISAKEYVSILEESFLFYEIKQFSYSLKEQHSSKKKIYLSDNGFAMLHYSFSKNLGALFENNVVFTELLKNGYEVFFYNKNNIECDFIAKKENTLLALQVCYE